MAMTLRSAELEQEAATPDPWICQQWAGWEREVGRGASWLSYVPEVGVKAVPASAFSKLSP